MKRREERKHKKLLRKSKKNWIVVGASVLTLGAVAGASIFSPDVEAQQISLEQAKEIAYKDAGINEEQISEIDDRELDDDGVYELEFRANGVEYEYNINADNGQIVEREGNSNQLRNQISQSSLVWTPRSVEEIENDLQGYETVEELGSYSIQWGDTLSAISQATGFSVNEIAETFGIQNPNLIIASYTFQEQADLEVNTVANPVSLVTGRLEEDDDIDDLDVEDLDDAYEDTDNQDDDRDDVDDVDDQDDDRDDVDETDDQDDDRDDVDETDDQYDDRDDVDDQDDDRDDVDDADDQDDDYDDVDETDDQDDNYDDVDESDDQDDDADDQTSETSQGAVTLEEAKAIAFEHAGVDGTNARFDDQELDDDGVYELEFVVDGVEYEYEIQASTGNIVGAERDGENVVASTRYGGSRDNATLTLEEAKAIAFEHAGVNGENARFDDQELDDDGVFELEFVVDGVEYEYDIDAATGEIIEAERDGVDNNVTADNQNDDRNDDDADNLDDQNDDRNDDADDLDDQDDDRYEDDADDLDDQDDDRNDDADDVDDQDDDRYEDDADDLDDRNDDRNDDDADDMDDQNDDQDDLEDDADDIYENDDDADDLDD